MLETDSIGQTQTYYTVSGTMAGQFGDLVSEHFPQATPSAYTEFYSFDALGSTDSLTDASGATDSHFVYTAFGTIAGQTGDQPNHRTFVGRFGYQDDANSGLYFADRRYHEADTGRWLSQDPIWPAAGANSYEYVGGNSPNSVDPNGLKLVIDADTLPPIFPKLSISSVRDFTQLTFMERARLEAFADKVLEALKEVIGDCATLEYTHKRTIAFKQSSQSIVVHADVTYSNEKPGCKCDKCWQRLKKLIDEDKPVVSIQFVTTDSEPHTWDTSDHEPTKEEKEAPRVYVFQETQTRISVTGPDGKIYYPIAPYSIILWHEVLGHGATGMGHPLNSGNKISNSMSKFKDPVIAIENEARACYRLNGKPFLDRVPRYFMDEASEAARKAEEERTNTVTPSIGAAK